MIAESGHGAFQTQCISTDPALLGVSAYKAFLADRRKSVAQRLNEFLSAGAPER
jgi:hypothetical protein